MNKMDFVEKVKLFNSIAGTNEEFNVRKSALYVGLIFEELGEMLESLNTKEFDLWTTSLDDMSTRFKSGEYDGYFDANVMDRVEFLDASVDIAVVSLGAGIAIGGDIVNACHAVADNNLTKFPIVNNEYTVLRDENGKIKKPDGYKSVELTEFVSDITIE
jgi:hypothetical protein